MHTSSLLLMSLVLGLILVASPVAAGSQSAVVYKNFTNDFSMEWFTHNLYNDKELYVRFTFRYEDLDITSWSSSGSNGIWMGIGFGKTVMNGSDIIMCQYSYYNDSSDAFVCTDRYASLQSLPPLDSERDTTDLSTSLV
jgi:hypothetical protein